MTKDRHEELMKTIMSKYENPEDCADLICELRTDFDESVSGDYVSKKDYDTVVSERDNIREKYIKRFFDGDEKLSKIPKKQHDDIQHDTTENLTFDQLFKFKEGYTGKDE